MPLSEVLYRVAKGKLDSCQHNKDPSCSSALPLPPENDVAELVRENGQALSSRVGKIEACTILQPPQSPRGRGRMGEASGTSFKFGGPVRPEIEDNLLPDYCSGGVTVTGNSSHNNLASPYRGGGVDRYVEMQYGERVEQERFYSAGHSVRSSSGPFRRSQMSPASFPFFRSRVVPCSCHNVQLPATAIRRPVSEDPNAVLTLRGGFPAMKSRDQHFLNSSHFPKSLASDKAKPDGISGRVVPTSSIVETVSTSSPGSIPCNGSRDGFSLIDSCSGTKSKAHPTKPSEQNPVSSEKRLAKETVPQGLPGYAIPYDGCKISKLHLGSGAKGLDNGAKNVGRPSDDAVRNKRKHQDSEEYEGHSEDYADEESIGAKRSSSAQGGTSAKRNRAAEVHNLSERRRRDRINEKLRALQELIPNCNKVDRASMLDEAIDYLKTLQQQVQFMSMGSGLYMPSMVLPPGMSQMHAAHMARFSNMGVGMGMGFGFGMCMPDVNGGASGFPMLQAPSIPGAHFLHVPVPGPSPLTGFGLGIAGQGLPMPYPYQNTTMGTPAHGPHDASGSSQVVAPSLVSREAIPSINSEVIPQNGANGSANPTSSKCQETKECHQQSALVRSEHQAAGVADNQTS